MTIPSKVDNQTSSTSIISQTACENCETEMTPQSQFCSNCGQEKIESESFSAFLDQFMKDYFTFDSKILRSFTPLIFRPGFLTKAYLDGHRIRYIPPLRLFIFTSIIFFLLLGLSPSTVVESDVEDLKQAHFWDRFFTSLLPKLFFFILPYFAFLVHVFFGKKKRSFIRPFLFSAHFHSFVFVLGALYWLSSKLFLKIGLIEVNYVLSLIFMAYVLIYLWLALRKVYELTVKQQILRFSGLLSLYFLGLVLGATLLIYGMRS